MALLFTVLCGAASLSLGYFINYFAKGHFIDSTESVLDSEIRYIKAAGYERAIKTSDKLIYAYLKADGSLPDDLSQNVSLLSEGIIILDQINSEKRYATKIHTFSDGRKLLVGKDITEISRQFRFMQWLGIASIGFVMIVVFVSYLISVFVVSGTNKIADTAHEIINTGDLSRRIEVGSQWDDLSNLGAVLNILLARIQELMRGVREVSDNIAHDLRTPLTRMRNKIESLDDSEQKTELLNEADHILSTFNALLRISKIESEQQRSHFEGLDLTALLNDVIEFYEPLAEERKITLDVKLNEVQLTGDRDLLFQAYANLLDNALKFTPSGGNIYIGVSTAEGTRISIQDSGPGINSDENETIFRRFYRGEKSRSSAGTGLGLSLVKAVIELHGGKVYARNANPGLEIITEF